MPISDFLSQKWDEKLYNWLLWRGGEAGGCGDAKISSIYDPKAWQRGSGYRSSAPAVLSGDAMDTDALLHEVRRGEERIYLALVAWTVNDGTRGAQAGRLSTHQDTYRDWVDSGKRWLERLSHARKRPVVEPHQLLPERV